MRIRVTGNDLGRQKADLAVCFAFEGDRKPHSVDDARLARLLAARMRAEGFRGRPGDRVVWNTDGRYEAPRFLVIGLGRRGETPGEAIRAGCARAARQATRFSAGRLALRLPVAEEGQVELEARAAAEGTLLGAYRFDRHLTDPDRREVELAGAEISSPDSLAAVRRGVRKGETGAGAVCIARDLVNEGPSRKRPDRLAREAARLARAAGLQCKVLGATELRGLGMSSLMSVARGSDSPPRVVHLTYRPKGKRPARGRKKIVLVGKGVTFDSGGLNLKPGDSMLTMKSDMSGAAAVLATMTALPAAGCRAEVHGLLGLVENMTGSAAYKPGDILDTYSGKTVEVINTDAEGRLVLCDLLAYAAKRLKPSSVVDVATLTGACVVALGTAASGLFTRHDELAGAVLDAGRMAGEKLWRLPLYDEYLDQLQKGPADLRNLGERWGGAITAALFLGEFVPRSLPWLHLDIAGPAFTEKDLPEARVGATGAGVLTLLRWLETS
jgi:leucyl aminopeptidase